MFDLVHDDVSGDAILLMLVLLLSLLSEEFVTLFSEVARHGERSLRDLKGV